MVFLWVAFIAASSTIQSSLGTMIDSYVSPGSTVDDTVTVIRSSVLSSSVSSNSSLIDSTVTNAKVNKTYVGEKSIIDGSDLLDCSIQTSKVRNSKVNSTSVGQNSIIDESYLWSMSVQNSNVFGSNIESADVQNSNVSGSRIQSASVQNSIITNCTIINCRIQNRILINETCINSVFDENSGTARSLPWDEATTPPTETTHPAGSTGTGTVAPPAEGAQRKANSAKANSASFSLSSEGTNGTTTRYWDCCKPSCAWVGNLDGTTPTTTCAKDGQSLLPKEVQNGCEEGGSGFVCNTQQPFVAPTDIAYGFAAANQQQMKCCSCYQLTFTSGPVIGKTMIVQVTNTGKELVKDQFDLQIPGGGVGYFADGCKWQWGAPHNGWGEQYGGISSKSDCSQLPQQLQEGCEFRFGWFQNANNPTVTYVEVKCPEELTDKSGCL